MQSCAWPSRPQQQFGQPSQYANQFTYNKKVPAAAAANATCWDGTETTGVTPPNFTPYHQGRYHTIKPRNQQAVAAPHQVPAGRNGYHQRDTVQPSSANAQSGFNNLPVSCGFQQDFPQNSAQNSSNQSPRSVAANTAYSPQLKTVHWNQSVRVYREQSVKMQVDTTAYNYQQRMDQNGLFLSFNGESTCTTTAISPAPKEVVYTGAAFTRQPAHQHSARINNTQHPDYYRAPAQAEFGNNCIRANATQYKNITLLLPNGKNQIPLNGLQKMTKLTARIEGYPRQPPTAGSDGCSSRSPKLYVGKNNFASMDKIIDKTKENVQPVALEVTKMCSMNSSQSLFLNSRQSLPKTTNSIMPTQHSVDVPPQQSSGLNTTSLSNPDSPKSRPDASGVEPYPYLQNPTQMLIDASSDCAFVANKPQDSQKQSRTEDTGCELVDVPVDQLVAVTAQQSEPKDVFDLSSVPTTPWTHGSLTKLVQSEGKAQMAITDEFDLVKKVTDMFWDDNILDHVKDLKCVLQRAEKFCREKDSEDSIILSQVMPGFEKQLKNYHVLEHGEVYPEVPYKSSWLNMNEQLDVIDREFGFPQTLKQPSCTIETNGQSDQPEMHSSSPSPTGTEVSNEKLSPKELKPAESRKVSEEKQDAALDSASTQLAPDSSAQTAPGSPASAQTAPDSSAQAAPDSSAQAAPDSSAQAAPDSSASTQKAPGSSALAQAAPDSSAQAAPGSSATAQTAPDSSAQAAPGSSASAQTAPDSSAQAAPNSSGSTQKASDSASAQTALPNETDSTDFSDSFSFNIQVLSPEEAKIIFEQLSSNQPQSTEPTEDQPERHSSVEGGLLRDGDAPSRKDLVCPVEEFCCIELMKKVIWGLDTGSECQCKHKPSHKNDTTPIQEENAEDNTAFLSSTDKQDLCYVIDLTEHKDQPPTYSVKELQSCSESSNPNWKSITLSSDDEDHNQMSDCEGDSEGAQVKLTESQSTGSEGRNLSRAEGIQSDPEVDFGQDEPKSSGNKPLCYDIEIENLSDSEGDVAGRMLHAGENDEAALLSSEKELSETSATCTRQTADSSKQAKKRKRPRSPDRFFPIFKKSNKPTSLVARDDDEPPASRVRTVKLSLFGSTGKNKCVLGGSRRSCASSHAPECLIVSLSPKKSMRKKSISTWNYSVQQLYKKWKISFPPSKVNTGNLTRSGKDAPLRLNRMWSLTDEDEDIEKDGDAVMPSQNSDVLSFGVLPQSFTFADGFNGREDSSDSVPDKPDLLKSTVLTPKDVKAKGPGSSSANFRRNTRKLHRLT